MMKKLLLAFTIAGAFTANAQQVQNPGFETWANNFPTGWGSFGQAIFTAFGSNPNTDVQTASAHSGSFAMLMQNQFLALASSNIPGGVVTGPMGFTGQPVKGFQAYAGQPVSYDFWYKFNAMANDSAYTTLIITKWNTGLNKRDTLAAAGSYIITAAAAYTQVTIPITWLINAAPDSIQLFFSSSRRQVGGTNQPPTGGQLFIDDVNFNMPVGVQNLLADGSFAMVYPNPASNVLNISTNSQKAKFAKVYDLTGRNIATYELTGSITKVDISSYENGVYIYTVMDEENGKVFTAKFSVAK